MKKYGFAAILFFILTVPAAAQDTLRVSLSEFIQRAKENSGQIKYEQTKIEQADNQLDQAKYLRFMPRLNFESEHAAVPGVTSPNNFSEDRIYLDPEAKNDWTNFGVYTRLRVSGAQPVFTWGAINKAVKAASNGVKAAREETKITEAELEIQLFQLYYSYVLALEIERLVKDADEKVEQIGRAINKTDADYEVREADRYKFKIFEAEFEAQKFEVQQSLDFVKSAWEYALRNDSDFVFEPEMRFLDPLDTELLSSDYYQKTAMLYRPELRGLEYGKEAMKSYVSAVKAQNLPGLYFGITTTFASTPIRPRQPNPFISTPENTFNTALGFSIRQNLNFLQVRNEIDRSKIELKKMTTLKEAAQDGIMLQVLDAYKNAAVNEVKVQQTGAALVTTKEWLMAEQLDYDFGIGRAKDLIDAMRKELELRLKEKEQIFDYNISVIKLNISAGLPLTTNIDN